jgi:flagellar hook-associated protein FlgK
MREMRSRFMEILSTPIQGLSNAEASFNRAASNISKSFESNPQNPQDQVSLSDAMVSLLNSKNDYEANLKSLKTSDEMTKTVLDILA